MRANHLADIVRSRRAIALGRTTLLVVALLGLALVAGAQSGIAGGGSATSTDQQAAVLTPPNQPALDAAADDARAIAAVYFTSATVDDQANTVTITLSNAPQSILDQLTAAHPDLYIIDNTGAYSSAYLTDLQNRFEQQLAELATQGVDVTQDGPTPDGHLQVFVRGEPGDLAATLNAAYGTAAIQVVQDTSPTPVALSTRYNDSFPWNGGDFIYHKSSSTDAADCTAGVPVHDNNTYTEYIITAAHCFFSWGIGIPVRNGYVRADNSEIYSGSSETSLGDVQKESDISGGGTYDDVALIGSTGSGQMFTGDWNGQSTNYMYGLDVNNLGDEVCTSGAFDGQICNIKIVQLDQTVDVNEGSFIFRAKHQDEALNNVQSNHWGNAAGAGDSGGPVYSDDNGTLKARGMIDSGALTTSCYSQPPGFPVPPQLCSQFVWFTGMSWIENDWGVTVG